MVLETFIKKNNKLFRKKHIYNYFPHKNRNSVYFIINFV